MKALNEAWTAREKRERQRFNILVQCITGVNPEENEASPKAEFERIIQHLKRNG